MAECSKVEDDQGDACADVSANLSTGLSCLRTNFLPARSSFTHTPFYCEENVYLLCKKLSMLGLADPSALDLFVVFISNEDKKIPLWHQKASKSSEGLVIWDYHVICIQIGNQKRDKESLIWDLDSSLPFPLPLGKYVSETFRQQLRLNSTFRRVLRMIHAPIFLRHFASNRAHMRDSLGNWISPPPSYEPIIAHDYTQNTRRRSERTDIFSSSHWWRSPQDEPFMHKSQSHCRQTVPRKFLWSAGEASGATAYAHSDLYTPTPSFLGPTMVPMFSNGRKKRKMISYIFLDCEYNKMSVYNENFLQFFGLQIAKMRVLLSTLL